LVPRNEVVTNYGSLHLVVNQNGVLTEQKKVEDLMILTMRLWAVSTTFLLPVTNNNNIRSSHNTDFYSLLSIPSFIFTCSLLLTALHSSLRRIHLKAFLAHGPQYLIT
jgi:hypothetical protein